MIRKGICFLCVATSFAILCGGVDASPERNETLQIRIKSLMAKLGQGAERATCAGWSWGSGSLSDEAAAELAIIGLPCADSVMPLLKDRSGWRRIFAINILERIHDVRAVHPIIAILRYDPDGAIRSHAAGALERLGDPTACEALNMGLADKDRIACACCADALGSFRDERAIPRLIGLIDGPVAYGGPLHFPNPPESARDALAKIGKPAEPALIRALGSMHPRDRDLRVNAAYALGEMRSSTAVNALVKALGDYEDEVACEAARALGSIGDKRAVEPLIAMAKSEEPKQASAALSALGKLGDERALPVLVSALDRPRTFTVAVLGLGYLKSPLAVDPLLQILNKPAKNSRENSDPETDSEVVGALGKIGGPAAENALIAALDHVEPSVRMEAAKGLGRLRIRRAIEPLTRLLASEVFGEADTAAEAIGRIDHKRLLELFDGAAAAVRKNILYGIARLENPADATLFLSLVHDPNLNHAAISGLHSVRAVQALPQLIALMKGPGSKADAGFRHSVIYTISELQEIERTGSASK